MKRTFTGPYETVPLEIFQSNNGWSVSDESVQWAGGVAKKVTDKLAALKIKATCDEVVIGATTTTIRLSPSPEVRMSRFSRIDADLSIAVGASVRVIAPIPNTNYVGVEMPSNERRIVRYGDVYFPVDDDGLNISLGVRPNGDLLNFDLAKAPHLLVSGSSGSGKSVCLNTIIMGLLSAMSPRDLELRLIDVKRVELSCYEGLPHVRSIDTDVWDAKNTLSELCDEMDRRYSVLREAGVRKKVDYQGEDMPYCVVILDEFSDLIGQDDGEIERLIVRLAQLGRACGIHLILATQRPDKDILTGLIKANFPTRIAFRTSTAINSRIILDSDGAEKLIGNGDALFLHSGKISRFQCAYVSDGEIETAVQWCKEQPLVIEEIEEPEPMPDFALMSYIEQYAVVKNGSIEWRRELAAATEGEYILYLLSQDEDESVRGAVKNNPLWHEEKSFVDISAIEMGRWC